MTRAECRGGSGESSCWQMLIPTSGLQMALAEDAVLELLWGWLFWPFWPPGFQPWQHEPLGCSS